MKLVTLQKKVKWALKNDALTFEEKYILEDFITSADPLPADLIDHAKSIIKKRCKYSRN